MKATGSRLGALSLVWLVPLHARLLPDFSLWLLPALAVIALLLLAAPYIFLRASLRPSLLLGAAYVTFVAVAIGVAMIHGFPEYSGRPYAALVVPYLRTQYEYYGDVPQVDRLGGPALFLAGYALPAFHATLSMHAQTHPPGGVLFLWLAGRCFGPGLWPAALTTIGFTALAIGPVYGLGREIYGERVSRAALLLFTLTPNVVLYTATSMDGPFAVLPILTLYLFYRAQRPSARPLLWGILFGLALAVATFMTYAVLFLPVFFAVLLLFQARPDSSLRLYAMVRTLAIGLGAFLAFYVTLYELTGFDPLAAARAAANHDRVMMGTGYETLGRYLNVSFGNLVAYSLGIGLPIAVTSARQLAASLRRLDQGRQADAFVAAFALTLVLMAFSTLFTLEVERIWLFTAPFVVLPATCYLIEAEERDGHSGPLRWVAFLLAFQLLVTETILQTPW